MTADQSPLHSRASTDRLRGVLAARLPADPKWVAWVDGVVGDLAGCVVGDTFQSNLVEGDRIRAVLGAPPVDATPPQGIDRAAFLALLDELSDDDRMFDQDDLYQGLLALVRPVEGVTLTPEEARLLVSTLRRTDEWHAVHFAALAARLEASS